MAGSMKELEGRIEALEQRADEGGDLAARVQRLENLTGQRPQAEADRVEADKALVSRFANSRDEAIAQQAARERLADLGLIDERGGLRAARPDAEVNEDAPVGSEVPSGTGDGTGAPAGGGSRP